MRSLLIACLFGVFAAAVPVTAQAHWHHRFWHHGWHRGPSYFPVYGYYDADPSPPVCVWRRGWEAFWYRDCF
jgi:hypothetical protein